MEYNVFNVKETDEYIKAEYPVGINFLTFYGRYEKGIFDISQQKLISEDYVEAGYYEGVFANSIKNPLTLHNNSRTHLYDSNFLSYCSIIYYKDTENIGINYTIRTVGLSLRNKKAFTVKKDFYTLYIEKESGKPSMFKNKKLCYTNKCLNSAFRQLVTLVRAEKIKELDLIRIALEEYFLPKGYEKSPNYFHRDYISLLGLYRVKRSYHLLKDLPWNQEALLNLYVSNPYIRDEDLAKQREKILVQLRKGNTKKATDICFYGNSYPKSIKKLVLKYPPLSARKETYDSITEAINRYDVNTVRSLYQISPAYFHTMLACLKLGFSSKHVINVAKTDLGIIRDTVRLSHLLRNETLEFNSNIHSYHDYLDNLYRIRNPRVYSRGVNFTDLYGSVDTSEEYARFETESLVFRSPKTANELPEVGQALHICVGQYTKSFFTKVLDIVLITDKEDKYVGCIEIKNGSVVQAKLKYNKTVFEDKTLLKDTLEWMESADLKIHTNDLTGEGSFIYIEDSLPDLARAELMIEYTKTYKGEVRGQTLTLTYADVVAEGGYPF